MQIIIQKNLYIFCLLFVSFCYVAETNKQTLLKIAGYLRNRREALSYSQRDVSEMTGLTVNTISNMENNGKATLNSFLLVCRALNLQPKEVFSDDIVLEPHFNLPPSSKKRLELTRQLEELIYHSDFFDDAKRVADVTRELGVDPSLSNRISVFLGSYCKKGSLEYFREGKINRYKKKS